jgi:hypothetical protein
LIPGNLARLKVRLQQFDGGKEALKIEPEWAIPGVQFDNNIVEAGSSQVELRVSAVGPVTAKSFRLRAGDALSPAKGSNLDAWLADASLSNEDVLKRIFLASLVREPDRREIEVALRPLRRI